MWSQGASSPSHHYNGSSHSQSAFEAVGNVADKVVDDEKAPSKPAFVSMPPPQPPKVSKRSSSSPKLKTISDDAENDEDEDSKRSTALKETNALEEVFS